MYINDIKFITNQPWPFPSSLMFGLIAKAKNKKLKIDKNEIEDVLDFKTGTKTSLMEGIIILLQQEKEQ